MAPPYLVPLPARQQGRTNLSLPSGNQALFGKLADAFGTAKTGYTARAFLDGNSCISNVATLKADGSFGLFVPAAITGDVSESNWRRRPALIPGFTFSTRRRSANRTTTSGNGHAPGLPGASGRRVAWCGAARASRSPALRCARARSSNPDTLHRRRLPGVTRFWQGTTTGANGNANVTLIPGVNRTPRLYDVTVAVPPPGSVYASTCAKQQPIPGRRRHGEPSAVALRPVLSGTVSSSKGARAGQRRHRHRAAALRRLAKVCSATGPTAEFSTTTGENRSPQPAGGLGFPSAGLRSGLRGAGPPSQRSTTST